MFDPFDDDTFTPKAGRFDWIVTASLAFAVIIWGLALYGAYVLIFGATCP